MYINSENVGKLSKIFEGDYSVKNFFPSVYVLDPASQCNLSCVMCPNSQMPQKDLGFIDFKIFEKIINAIAPYAEFLMLYWMGETLLHPQIIEILTLARRKIKGKIVVSSNMTVSDIEILKALKSNSDIILCSLDRWEKNSYEKIRRGACFNSVIKNIEKLIEIDFQAPQAEIIVKALDINHNSEEYLNFQQYWSDRGVRTLFAWLNDWAGTFKDMRNAGRLPIPRKNPYRTPCADLWFKMVINWRGEIFMCCFDWHYKYKIGDITSENWLKDTWNGKRINKLREMHLSGDYNENSFCKKCNAWGETTEHDAYINWTEDSYFIVF